jgi:transcriptional regulator with GAF, ATPase, and Fis domain
MNAQQQKSYDKINLTTALKQCRGKIYGNNGAAVLLGLKPTTLSSRLKKHRINRQEFIT